MIPPLPARSSRSVSADCFIGASDRVLEPGFRTTVRLRPIAMREARDVFVMRAESDADASHERFEL
jgi:hypothetical protein